MIPKRRFALLVHEICERIMKENHGPHAKGLRWEADALSALQIMTEHILVMLMEMRDAFLMFN